MAHLTSYVIAKAGGLPQLLNLIVAIYLIIVGPTGLLNKGTFNSKTP